MNVYMFVVQYCDKVISRDYGMLYERKWTFYNAVCIIPDELALIKSDTTTWNVDMETSPVSL